MMKNKLIYFLVFLLAFSSCQNDRFDIDTTGIDAEIEIKRLDQDLFELNIDSLPAQLPEIEEKYGDFWTLYTTQIVPLGKSNTRKFWNEIRRYVEYPTTVEVQKEVQQQFSDLTWLEEDLEQAFVRLKYYFPEHKEPAVYTCISSFNYAVVTAENLLGIGLDMYLGEECDFYNFIGIDQYKKRQMYPEKIVSDCMHSWIAMTFAFNDSIDNLAAHIVYQGKLMYLLDALLPETPATHKFGYTERQLKWAETYQDKIWAYMIEQEHLFGNDPLMISKYTKDAPFTTFFANNSAPKAGVFIGYKIVQKYMDETPQTTIAELMAENDYQKILNGSKYNP